MTFVGLPEVSWRKVLDGPRKRFTKSVHRAYRKTGRFPKVRKMNRRMKRIAKQYSVALMSPLGHREPTGWLTWSNLK